MTSSTPPHACEATDPAIEHRPLSSLQAILSETRTLLLLPSGDRSVIRVETDRGTLGCLTRFPDRSFFSTTWGAVTLPGWTWRSGRWELEGQCLFNTRLVLTVTPGPQQWTVVCTTPKATVFFMRAHWYGFPRMQVFDDQSRLVLSIKSHSVWHWNRLACAVSDHIDDDDPVTALVLLLVALAGYCAAQTATRVESDAGPLTPG